MVDTAAGEVITLSTAPGVVAAMPPTVQGGAAHTVPARSVLVLQRTSHDATELDDPRPHRRARPTGCSSPPRPRSPTASGCCPTSTRSGSGALYASPLLESGAGSNHGYDVVDPTRVSQERGGEAGPRAR